jgi:hypothetical protein
VLRNSQSRITALAASISVGEDFVGSRHDGDDAGTIFGSARDHERDLTDRVVADAAAPSAPKATTNHDGVRQNTSMLWRP